jgi:hypothetical protein
MSTVVNEFESFKNINKLGPYIYDDNCVIVVVGLTIVITMDASGGIE